MSKKFICILIGIILLSSFTEALSSSRITSKSFMKFSQESDYSHTVFAGIALTQGCGPCHIWNQEIYDAYASGEYDFHYSAMIVYDKDGDVLNREAYDWDSEYGIYTYPTSIFDGDYVRITGDNPEEITDALNASGNRSVANITANITLSWIGNATINVTTTIQNNEATQYNGSIRAFITEIVSRYKTSQGDYFHFGFLGFAFDGDISIAAGGNYTNSTNWNGYEHEDEHGNDFGDINAHNIKVILALYNDNNGYVDETVAANISNHPPNEPNDPYPANGSTGVDVNIDLSWKCDDPEDDPLSYDVYFGETNPPPKIISNQTNSSYEPGTLNITQTYYWRIIAWDNYNESTSGPIWNFKTRLNQPPKTPEKPNGPNNGNAGTEYAFYTRTNDSDNDQVFYIWDWGDGNFSEWMGPYIEGVTTSASHIWNQSGEFEIRVKAKDIVNSESNWSQPFIINIVKPAIEIGNIKGGLFRIKAAINNFGDGEAIEVKWNINLIGGFILRGHQSTGTITRIPPGEEINITSNRIIGIGRTDVVLTVEMLEGNIYKKTENGIIFLFLIRV
jgi:hypothetical protein